MSNKYLFISGEGIERVLRPGDRVTYVAPGRRERGRVKRIADGGAFVVYHCDGNWERFEDYTAALTRAEDLELGWR